MKRLWFALLSVSIAIAAGPAIAAVPGAERAAAPDAAGNGVVLLQVDWHHHGHRYWDHRGDDDDGGGNFYLGFGNYWGPEWGPYWGPQSYYYSPPLIINSAPSQRTIYISHEQENQRYYWYYCKASHRYYPYVKQCPGGWMKVVPHPPRN